MLKAYKSKIRKFSGVLVVLEDKLPENPESTDECYAAVLLKHGYEPVFKWVTDSSELFDYAEHNNINLGEAYDIVGSKERLIKMLQDYKEELLQKI